MRAGTTYYPALDGLRALAVLAVLLFHAEIPWAPGGFLGVSTFFTLSGFLITRLLLADLTESGTIDLRRFWTRRFRRLMPASLLGLGLALALAAVATPLETLARLRGDVLAALLYVSNWRFMRTAESYFAIFEDPSPVQHFWSLSIEEQFYLCYPIALLALWRWRPSVRGGLAGPITAVTVATVVTGVLLTATGAPQARVYYGTDTRAPELLVGALLAFWMARPGHVTPSHLLTECSGALALAALLAAVVLVHRGTSVLDHGGFAAHAVVTAALLHAAVQPTAVARVLAVAPLRSLGRISYGVYVYHWPLFLWLDAERTGLPPGPLFALRLAATLALATASFAVVEWPVRTERRLRAGRVWLVTAAAAAVIAAVALRLPRHARPQIDITATLDEIAFKTMPVVEPRDGVPPLRVLVVGDSVAGDMAGGLNAWAQKTGTSLVTWNLGRSACAIGRGGNRPTVRGYIQLQEWCATWPHVWGTAVERFDPDVVVVHTGPLEVVDRQRPEWGDRTLAPGAPEFDAWLLGEFEAAADLLAARGARVVWLTTPCTGESTSPSERLTMIGDLRRVLHVNRYILRRLAAARPHTVRLFDLFAKSCPNRTFSQMIPAGRLRLRRDALHYTPAGATWIAHQLGPVVVEEARERERHEAPRR